MKQVLLSTTGTLSPVVIEDFGERTFVHPTVGLNLIPEFTIDELSSSDDLQAALTAGYITLEDENGSPIIDVSEQISSSLAVLSDSTLITSSVDTLNFQGASLSQGETGTVNIVGLQGVQGLTGPQGLTGNTGAAGANGPQGPRGLQGFKGNQGFDGLQGAKGNVGVQGANGTQGARGFQGNTGNTGAQGLRGFQGFRGFQGVRGFQGFRGFQGASIQPNTTAPALQVRRSTNYVLTTSYVDLTWDLTDIETSPTVIKHNVTNTDNIDILVTGLYQVSYAFSVDADAGVDTFDFRVRENDTTVINGSTRQISEDDEINDVGNVFVVHLTAGSFITVQGKATGGTNTLIPSGCVVVTKLDAVQGFQGLQGTNPGQTGPQGPAGSTTVYGTQRQDGSSDAQSSTTATTFQQKLRITTPSLPSGTYRIGWYYEIAHTSQNTSVEVQGQINDSTTMFSTLQELKDPTDWIGNGGMYHGVLSGVNNIDIDFRKDGAGGTASIRRVRIEIWREA